MATESASDLAGMFDAGEFAETARYAPPAGGAGTDCRVIVDRGQGRRRFDAGKRDVKASERHLWVRAAEVAAVQRGGTFTLVDEFGNPTGEVYRVADMPALDQTGALWSVDLTIVG